MISSRHTRMRPGRYVRLALGVFTARWWWAPALPLIVLILLGLSDIIYIAAAIGLVLVVYPALLMGIYYSYALRPEAAYATVEHTVGVDATGLTIDYYPPESMRPIAARHIPIADIASVEDTGSSILITLSSSPYDFIEISADALEPGDMTRILQILGHNS